MSWSFFCDRGGTFTDIVAKSPTGELRTAKVLSVAPSEADYEDAAVHGICQLLGVAAPSDIPPGTIDVVRVGTTVATNSILERRGAPTVFVTTAGFRDALRIGTQARPNIFARNIELHSMLYEEECVVEATERVAADGSVVTPLDEAELEQKFAAAIQLLNKKFSSSANTTEKKSSSDNNSFGFSAAICFVHGYKYPEHEQRAAHIALNAGFSEVCISSAVSPIIRFVPRADTTVVDAYVTPPIRAYAARLKRLLPAGTKLQFMQSSGGIANADHFRGKDAVLSGPAGGAVAMVETALAAGCGRIVSLDVGGTSADVAHYAGEYERDTVNTIQGIRIRAPMLSIHTVAAGGGSILGFDGHRLLCGPHSAGAQPGPACYGRGGPLTVTDANVLLGRVQRDHFPATFGPDSKQPLDVGVVRDKFAALAERINLPRYRDPFALAAAFIDLAVQQMADAVKKISVARGYDITGGYVLNVFGGAGGQLACAVAQALGIKKVMLHPLASILSAYGIGLSKSSTTKMRDLALRLPRATTREDDSNSTSNSSGGEMARIVEVMADLEKQGRMELGLLDSDSSKIKNKYTLFCNYDGGDAPLELHLPSGSSTWTPKMIWELFEKSYFQRYAHYLPNDIIATVASVETLVEESLLEGCLTVEQQQLLQQEEKSATPVAGNKNNNKNSNNEPETFVDCFAGGTHREKVALFERSKLLPNVKIGECALIVDKLSTTFLEEGWSARVDRTGVLFLEKKEQQQAQQQQESSATVAVSSSFSSRPDPLRLEILAHFFMNVAEQAGLQLQRTALSVNMKERLDFSCGVFDAEGKLIANAPHLPVHAIWQHAAKNKGDVTRR